MPGNPSGFQSQARAQAEEMLHAIASAEQIIVSTIERECEALRTGRMLAAKALHTHLCDAAGIYLNAIRAAQASITSIEQVAPGICDQLEERRSSFASLLKIEMAVLAAEQAAASDVRASALEKTSSQGRADGSKRAPIARLAVINDSPRPHRSRKAS